jgi:hypothetical protein
VSQLSTIREALAAQIRAAGWARQFTVYPYDAGGIDYPAVVISLAVDDPIDWVVSFGAGARLGTVRMRLRLLIPADSSPETALRALDDVLSQGDAERSSVADTIFDDPTLGGVVDSVTALSVSSVGLTNADTGEALVGADIPLTIYVRRT